MVGVVLVVGVVVVESGIIREVRIWALVGGKMH